MIGAQQLVDSFFFFFSMSKFWEMISAKMDTTKSDNHALLMTPEIWGKPIDVAEDWIHFVDDNVLSSEWLSFHSSTWLTYMI